MQGPPLCVVFCAFQAILARQPVSRLLALLSRPLSPAPRARSPPPFLFVAYHRLLATKKKKNSHHRRKIYFDSGELPLGRRALALVASLCT